MSIVWLHNYIKNECDKDSNIFEPVFFNKHILVVRDIALELGKYYNADLELIEVSSYLHDCAAIKSLELLRNHEEDGALIARKQLSINNYEDLFIQKVELIIKNHSNPTISSENKECLCVANADVISKYFHLDYWYYYCYKIRNNSFDDAQKWIKKQLIDKYERLDKRSKCMVHSIHAVLSQTVNTNVMET